MVDQQPKIAKIIDPLDILIRLVPPPIDPHQYSFQVFLGLHPCSNRKKFTAETAENAEIALKEKNK
jgi:hypothetical protein